MTLIAHDTNGIPQVLSTSNEDFEKAISASMHLSGDHPLRNKVSAVNVPAARSIRLGRLYRELTRAYAADDIEMSLNW